MGGQKTADSDMTRLQTKQKKQGKLGEEEAGENDGEEAGDEKMMSTEEISSYNRKGDSNKKKRKSKGICAGVDEEIQARDGVTQKGEVTVSEHSHQLLLAALVLPCHHRVNNYIEDKATLIVFGFEF